MIKFCRIIFFVIATFYANIVWSKDNNAELDQVLFPKKPKCESQLLLDKVIRRIEDFTYNSYARSTISKRKNALIKANINGFATKNIKTFKPEDDFNTANALMSLKINKQLTDDDIILCKQTGNHKLPLYLLIYPQEKDYMVHIINLDIYSDDYEKISFTYP